MAEIRAIGSKREPNIVNMVYGSHLYGLSTPNSDLDYKGVYLPKLNEVLLGTFPQSFKASTGDDRTKNKAGDVDAEVMALSRFLQLACDGETMALDMLHCHEPLMSTEIWDDLVEQRTRFYSKDMRAFIGYLRKQAAKYGVKGKRMEAIEQVLDIAHPIAKGLPKGSDMKLREIVFQLPQDNEYCRMVLIRGINQDSRDQEFYEVCGRKYQLTITVVEFVNNLSKVYDQYGDRAKAAKDNDGVDWKAVSHALRVGYQMRDIFLHGDYEYPLEQRPFIYQVKTGQLDYVNDVQPRLDELVAEVEDLSDNSTLPARVDRKYWDEWLLDVYYTSYPDLSGDFGDIMFEPEQDFLEFDDE